MLCTINENTIQGNLCMDAFRKLLRLPYKVYLMIRERFFLIPPPETHPPQPSSIMGEGMGEDGFQPSPFSTSGEGEVLDEERTVTVHPSPLTPPTRGGGKTFSPSLPITEGDKGGGERSGGGAELLQRTSDFEMPPLLEDQRISLSETLDRVLNTGVVVHGDITISVANIDLIYIGLRALLTSVETARQAGINPLSQYPNPNESEESLNGNLRF